MSVSSRLQIQSFVFALGIVAVRYDLRQPYFEALSLPGEICSGVLAT